MSGSCHNGNKNSVHEKGNLNTSDHIISNLVSCIQAENSSICREFKEALLARYGERRTNLSDFLAYLLKGSVDQSSNLFYKENVDFIALKEAFNHFVQPTTNEPANQPESTKPSALHQSMNIDLSACSAHTHVLTNTDFETALNMFETSSQLSNELKAFAEALLSIRPTSTETERVFSLAKLTLAPRRSSMKSDLLNDIIVINKFYKM